MLTAPFGEAQPEGLAPEAEIEPLVGGQTPQMPSAGLESLEYRAWGTAGEGCVKDTGCEAPGSQQGEVEDPEG